MTIEILDKAEDDLVNGYKFYEQQKPGLGAYFRESLSADIDSLRIHGGVHRVVYRNSSRVVQKISVCDLLYGLRRNGFNSRSSRLPPGPLRPANGIPERPPRPARALAPPSRGTALRHGCGLGQKVDGSSSRRASVPR